VQSFAQRQATQEGESGTVQPAVAQFTALHVTLSL
jgi:hypothetical protein